MNHLNALMEKINHYVIKKKYSYNFFIQLLRRKPKINQLKIIPDSDNK